MCEFCDLMPKEEWNSIIRSQTFGFFSDAAIEEAVRQANHNNDESYKQHLPKENVVDRVGAAGRGDGGKDDDTFQT